MAAGAFWLFFLRWQVFQDIGVVEDIGDHGSAPWEVGVEADGAAVAMGEVVRVEVSVASVVEHRAAAAREEVGKSEA